MENAIFIIAAKTKIGGRVMKKLFCVCILLLIAGASWACCGAIWTAPPPPPPPAPNSGGVPPGFDYAQWRLQTDNVYDVTRTWTKEWLRPEVIQNEFGIYTFSMINDKAYYKVETKEGAIYMARY